MKALGVPDQLGELKQDERNVELRFVNEQGQTEVWIYELAAPRERGALHLTMLPRLINGRILAAYLDNGVDSRLSNQVSSIERLTQHLGFHHNELGHKSFEDCDILSGRVKLG